jgi:hypothetical protein
MALQKLDLWLQFCFSYFIFKLMLYRWIVDIDAEFCIIIKNNMQLMTRKNVGEKKKTSSEVVE